MSRVRILIFAALVAAMLAVPQVAWAAIPNTARGPEKNNCFGIASGQRASTLHDTGEHASSFEEPRTGVGNLAFRVFGQESVGEAGALLADFDRILATECKEG